jgi:hydrogenase nickel incorporation protein HypB
MTEIEVERSLLDETNREAAASRALFDAAGVLCLNLMSSPGAGKTSVLEQTLKRLDGRLRVGVVEGDIQGSLDADRLERCGAPVRQINTHGSCHLDPRDVATEATDMGLDDLDVLVIENVGNLVCPAEFDLGEHLRVMLLSVTEGHDKPAKYPLMFRTSDLLLLNKVDLLPYCDFDVAAASATARGLNPAQTVLQVSCRTGQGLDAWIAWLEVRVAEQRQRRS